MIQTISQESFNQRRRTIRVNIGGVPLGSDDPVRIQSMANTSTGDAKASIQQCIRIINAGADYVRFTVPSLSDVESFARIKAGIRDQGYQTPLIADVHFNPDIALKVAEIADKVRINPGNFSDISKFHELLKVCQKFNTSLRIGVNHGSLSDKIMDKFGDTPLGMAESAMEYLRICRKVNFNRVVVSMKSSNVRVMIYATRLTAAMMNREGMNFPLHLGVTEAGEGEDGRIKSAVGIGTLLREGLGDTIRISLTEEPEAEIPVARKLIDFIKAFPGASGYGSGEGRTEFRKRISRITGNFGGNFPPRVYGFDEWDTGVRVVESSMTNLSEFLIQELIIDKNTILVYDVNGAEADEISKLQEKLNELNCDVPVVLRFNPDVQDEEDFLIRSAATLGGAFIDGFGDGIWITGNDHISREKVISISLGILQACRARMSKTEFISCPSCGRTHFNLMDALSRIKNATVHLKGLKIGVMGCIVNGPGEMADADYGYVGAGKGKITLYKAKEVIKKGIPEELAVDELIAIIKANGDWIDP